MSNSFKLFFVIFFCNRHPLLKFLKLKIWVVFLRMVVPSSKIFRNLLRTYIEKEKHIGSVVSEIFQYTQTDRQTSCYFIKRIIKSRNVSLNLKNVKSYFQNFFQSMKWFSMIFIYCSNCKNINFWFLCLNLDLYHLQYNSKVAWCLSLLHLGHVRIILSILNYLSIQYYKRSVSIIKS